MDQADIHLEHHQVLELQLLEIQVLEPQVPELQVLRLHQDLELQVLELHQDLELQDLVKERSSMTLVLMCRAYNCRM